MWTDELLVEAAAGQAWSAGPNLLSDSQQGTAGPCGLTRDPVVVAIGRSRPRHAERGRVLVPVFGSPFMFS